jgi:CBS domain-containing protein
MRTPSRTNPPVSPMSALETVTVADVMHLGPITCPPDAALAGAGSLTAADLATTEPLTIEPSAPLAEAALLMDEHGVAHLIVSDGAGPVGVVSTLDIAAALTRERAGRAAERAAWVDPTPGASENLMWHEREACGGVRVLEARGPLVFPRSRVFAERLAAIARAAPRGLVVDLSGVTTMDTGLAGVLGAAARQLACRGERVVIVAGDGDVRRTIANTARSCRVPVVPTRREAFAHVRSAPGWRARSASARPAAARKGRA